MTSFLGAYLKEKYQLQETLTEDQKVSWEDACKVWDEEDRKFMGKWKKNVKRLQRKRRNNRIDMETVLHYIKNMQRHNRIRWLSVS